MTKECIKCGNTNEKEIEYKTLIFDDGWKVTKKKNAWVCKDQYDCGMRVYGPKKEN